MQEIINCGGQSLVYFFPVMLVPLGFSALFLTVRMLHYGLYRRFGMPVEYLKRDHQHYRLTVEQVSSHPSLVTLSFWEWALKVLFALGWAIATPLLIFSSDTLIEAAKALSSYPLELRRALWRWRMIFSVLPMFLGFFLYLRFHPALPWSPKEGNFGLKYLYLTVKEPFNQEQLRYLAWFSVAHLPGSYYAMLLSWRAHGYFLVYAAIIACLALGYLIALYRKHRMLLKSAKAKQIPLALFSYRAYLSASHQSQGQAFEQLKAFLIANNQGSAADKRISLKQLGSCRYALMSDEGLMQLMQGRYHYQIRLIWLLLWLMMGAYYLDNL